MQGNDKLISFPFIRHITRMTTEAFANGFQQTETGSAASRPHCLPVTASHQILGMFCFAARETNALIFDG